MAPTKYKRAMVTNLVHRIFSATSSWKLFHKGLSEAKEMLCLNQYPESWYEPIIHKTLEKVLTGIKANIEDAGEKDKVTIDPHLFFLEYRGKISDNYAKKLHNTGVPIRVIMTLCKTKMVTPSLKERGERLLASNVVYKFLCPHCGMSDVGCTTRHLKTRIGEHLQNGEDPSPIRKHADECTYKTPSSDDFSILKKVRGNMTVLKIMEALYIREIKPQLNTRDEFRSRQLRISV